MDGRKKHDQRDLGHKHRRIIDQPLYDRFRGNVTKPTGMILEPKLTRFLPHLPLRWEIIVMTEKLDFSKPAGETLIAPKPVGEFRIW